VGLWEANNAKGGEHDPLTEEFEGRPTKTGDFSLTYSCALRPQKINKELPRWFFVGKVVAVKFWPLTNSLSEAQTTNESPATLLPKCGRADN
jgi:hypothetical protein